MTKPDTQLAERKCQYLSLRPDNIGNTGIISGTGTGNRGGVVLSVINTPTYAPIWDPRKARINTIRTSTGKYHEPDGKPGPPEKQQNKENRLIASGAATISFLPNLKLEIIRSPGPP